MIENRFRISLITITLCYGILACRSNPNSTLEFSSTPGDPIGQGEKRNYTANVEPLYFYSLNQSVDGRDRALIGVRSSIGVVWYLDLRAPVGQELQLGHYSDARLNDQAPAEFPSLHFFGNDLRKCYDLDPTTNPPGCSVGEMVLRKCDFASGQFTIFDLARENREIVKLSASFVQKCNGSDAPLTGVVNFKKVPELSGVAEPATTGNALTLSGSWSYLYSCGDPQTMTCFDRQYAEPLFILRDYYGHLGSGYDRSVSIDVVSPKDFRNIASARFTAPSGQKLVKGLYQNTRRQATDGTSYAGLDVGYNHMGCNTSIGDFEVLDLERNAKGFVSKFRARFQLSCDGGLFWKSGNIVFNAP